MGIHLSELQASAEGYSGCAGPPFHVFLTCLLLLHLRTEVMVVTLFQDLSPPGALRARAKIWYFLSAICNSEGGVSHNVAAIPPAAHPS